jgi:uracil-DNA glycosylase
MTIQQFNFKVVDSSWKNCLQTGLKKIDATYLQKLLESKEWLPGPEKIFNAFSLPLNQVNYVLFGESPYPRHESANGYAFWDAAVEELWSPTGLSKKVNRATSLRNILKMLLVAEGCLHENHLGQEAIAKINKESFVQSNHELFTNFLTHGFLLLNAAMVLQFGSPQKNARVWYPFVQEILTYLLLNRPQTKFILLGRIANPITKLVTSIPVKMLCVEHPYNHSFITNRNVLAFFKPLHLLRKI